MHEAVPMQFSYSRQNVGNFVVQYCQTRRKYCFYDCRKTEIQARNVCSLSTLHINQDRTSWGRKPRQGDARKYVFSIRTRKEREKRCAVCSLEKDNCDYAPRRPSFRQSDHFLEISSFNLAPIASHVFFASPRSMRVLSLKKTGFSKSA